MRQRLTTFGTQARIIALHLTLNTAAKNLTLKTFATTRANTILLNAQNKLRIIRLRSFIVYRGRSASSAIAE